MKVAIIGSRTITDFKIFNEAFNKNISLQLFLMIDTIVSGGAKGVDTLAAKFAKIYDFKLVEFLPDYEQYGRSAPFIRNKQIIDECDGVFAFWDGKSRGTQHAIKLAESQEKPVKLITIN